MTTEPTAMTQLINKLTQDTYFTPDNDYGTGYRQALIDALKIAHELKDTERNQIEEAVRYGYSDGSIKDEQVYFNFTHGS